MIKEFKILYTSKMTENTAFGLMIAFPRNILSFKDTKDFLNRK